MCVMVAWWTTRAEAGVEPQRRGVFAIALKPLPTALALLDRAP